MGTDTGVATAITWASAALTLPGELESGDRVLVVPHPTGVIVAVADGLGHGPLAADAAGRALAALQEHRSGQVSALVQRAHDACRATRGVALSLAAFSPQDDTLTWLGIGNIEGLLLRTTPSFTPSHEWMLVHAGVVGYALPVLRPSSVPLAPDDTLIIATDGIHTGFADGLNHHEPPQQLANQILSGCAKGNDDALVVVVRYRGRPR
jgi:serine/threonine protein phosphatase PrpC